MNILKQSFIALVSVVMVGAFSVDATAQEQRRTAVQAYNKASELAKNNEFEASIEKFKEAIKAGEAAQSSGEEGTDIVELSKEKLPGIYYEKALNDYKASQQTGNISSLETAIASFEEAGAAADQYGNAEISKKVASVKTQLNYKKSVLQYRAQDYEASMVTVNQVIEDNANYANAYYQKALILKKTGSVDDMLAMLDKAVEVATETNNDSMARKAKEKAASELIYAGSTKIQEKNYSGAITQLEKALEYDAESSDAHYRLAEAYNDRGDFKQGLTHGQKSLELENGGRSAKAKIYFEIATAYKGQGNFSQACTAFSDAAYGQFKGPAEHQMEYALKCENQTR